MSSPAIVEKLVRANFAAWAAKDRAALEALLAEDFHFSSPLDNRIDRETYFRICWPHADSIEGFDILRLAVDGDHAFVTYEVRLEGKRTRSTEVQTIRDDRIVEVEVYFGWDVPHPVKNGQHKG